MLELTDGRVVHAHQRRAPSRGRFAESSGAEHSRASMGTGRNPFDPIVAVGVVPDDQYLRTDRHSGSGHLLPKEKCCGHPLCATFETLPLE